MHVLSTMYNFDFKSTHIPGVLNVAFDALSRGVMQDYYKARPTGNKDMDVIGTLPPLRW